MTYYTSDLPLDVYNTIAHSSDLKTLISLCNTNKTTESLCTTTYFWEEHYKNHGLPFESCQRTFKEWIKIFRHDYNSLLLAKYLLKKQRYSFKLDYHYGGTGEILKYLKKMNIKHDRLKHTLDNGVKLTSNDLSDNNPEVFITKRHNLYSISLYMFHPYENDQGDDVEEEINFNDIAILNKKQILLFLYRFINSDYFLYKSMYSFHPGTYKEYGKQLNIKFE